jgi:protein-S-isoprenylcysteine O-methyltransferase Ste14
LRFLPAAAWLAPAGLSLQILSGCLAIWARRHLGRNWSGEVRVAIEHQLIRSGPYRLVRHPIYTAMLGMSAGTALVCGELHALLGVILLALAYVRKIRLEEGTLRDAFGGEYDDYRRRTWAIVPGLL